MQQANNADKYPWWHLFCQEMNAVGVQPGEAWRRLLSRYPYRLVGAILLLTLLSGGISTLPIHIFRAFVDYAAHPIEVMMPTAHGEQPLFFFLARGIGATNAIAYLALCLALWVLVYPAVFLGARKVYGPNEAVLMVLLFAMRCFASAILVSAARGLARGMLLAAAQQTATLMSWVDMSRCIDCDWPLLATPS